MKVSVSWPPTEGGGEKSVLDRGNSTGRGVREHPVLKEL